MLHSSSIAGIYDVCEGKGDVKVHREFKESYNYYRYIRIKLYPKKNAQNAVTTLLKRKTLKIKHINKNLAQISSNMHSFPFNISSKGKHTPLRQSSLMILTHNASSYTIQTFPNTNATIKCINKTKKKKHCLLCFKLD